MAHSTASGSNWEEAYDEEEEEYMEDRDTCVVCGNPVRSKAADLSYISRCVSCVEHRVPRSDED